MSSELTPYLGGGSLVRDARRAGRVISRHNAYAQMRTSQIYTETDVAIAKADALTSATGAAMADVVRVAQAQRHLELLVPEASPRLAMLADAHALSMSDVLSDLRRDLRRC